MLENDFDKVASERESVAIAFTPKHLRVMQLENRGGVHYVRSFAEINLKKGDIVDGVITNPEAMANTLIAGIINVEPSLVDTPYVVSFLPQQQIFLTTLVLPSTKKDELRSMLDHKVQDVIPMDINESYWDWHRLDSEGTRTRIQIAAIPKAIVDSYMETFAKARLTLLLLEPSSLAAARTLELADNAMAPTTILIEINEDDALVSLIKDGELLFTTQAIFQSEGINDVTQAISKSVNSLINYTASTKKEEQEPILLLYGNPDGVENLVPTLAKSTGYKVEALSLDKQGEQILKIVTNKRMHHLVPLIGSALRGLPNYPESSSINLVPQSAKEAFSKTEVANVLRNYVAYVALNVSLIVLLLAVVYLRINNQILETSQRYSAVLGITDSDRVKEIEESIHKLNQASKQRNVLLDQIYDWEIVTTQINQATPPGTTLFGLNVEYKRSNAGAYVGWNVSLSGKAAKRESVLKFVDNLRTGGVFSNVKIPLESFSAEDNVSFIIEAELSFESLKQKPDGSQ